MSVSILPSVDKNVFVSGSCDSLAKVRRRRRRYRPPGSSGGGGINGAILVSVFFVRPVLEAFVLQFVGQITHRVQCELLLRLLVLVFMVARMFL